MKNNNLQHTPTPWRNENNWILGADNICIFEWRDIFAPTANAAFIIRAVNSHEELLERLKSLHSDCLRCEKGRIACEYAQTIAKAERKGE